MFNTVTKIANSFKAWVAPQRKRKVITFPPAKNPATIQKARQEVLSTLKQILAKKQAELNAAIEEAQIDLHEHFYNGLHTDCLLDTLHKLNFHEVDDFGFEQLAAFTAAVDFYGGDDSRLFMTAITNAAKVIASGNYTFYANVNNYESLGREFFCDSVAGSRWRLPEWLEDYTDYAQLGKDVQSNTGGRGTRYGFFAPERTWA